MPSATVRISDQARETLRRLARDEGKPMQSVLEEAVEQYRREKFLLAANREFAAVRNDRDAWKQENAERATWDQTLGDGLDDE